MDDRFLLEAPQLSQTHKKYPLPLNSCNSWCVLGHMSRYGTRCRRSPKSRLKCVQVKSQPHCEACETGNTPFRFRERERYFAERSRKVTGASAGTSLAPSQRSSCQSIELSEVSPARSNSVDASRWYCDPHASLDRGHTSPIASSSLWYGLFPSPQSSNQDQWFSSPLMGSARPHYERWVCVRPSVRLKPSDAHAHSGRQHSHISSLLQLSDGNLCGYYTSYDIADTSNSQWDHMFNHVFPPSNSCQVNMPNLSIPVHRQNRPQSPNYLVNNPKTFFLAGSSSALEVASSSVPRVTPDSNADPHDAITQPIVDAVLNLCKREDQWPSVERVYLDAKTPPLPDTHEYSTDIPRRPTQCNTDSLAITLETASVSPYQQSPSPSPNTIASHLSLSPSSPGSLSGVFAVNSQPWQDVEIAESQTSPEAPSSVETDPEPPTIQQEGTRGTTVAEEPNYCHHCLVSFTQPQGFRRHLKDMHEDKELCTHCSSFKWSRGRPYLYRRHLRLKHSEVTSSEDRLRRTRKSKTVGARQRNIPNRKTEAPSGSVFPGPYLPCRDSISGPYITSPP